MYILDSMLVCCEKPSKEESAVLRKALTVEDPPVMEQKLRLMASVLNRVAAEKFDEGEMWYVRDSVIDASDVRQLADIALDLAEDLYAVALGF